MRGFTIMTIVFLALNLAIVDFADATNCTTIKPKSFPHSFPIVHHTTNPQSTKVQVEMELLLPPVDQDMWGIDFNIYQDSLLSGGREHIGWVAFISKTQPSVRDEVRVACVGDWPSVKVPSNWSTPTTDMKHPRHAIIQVEERKVTVLEVTKGIVRPVAQRDCPRPYPHFPDIIVKAECYKGTCAEIRQCQREHTTEVSFTSNEVQDSTIQTTTEQQFTTETTTINQLTTEPTTINQLTTEPTTVMDQFTTTIEPPQFTTTIEPQFTTTMIQSTSTNVNPTTAEIYQTTEPQTTSLTHDSTTTEAHQTKDNTAMSKNKQTAVWWGLSVALMVLAAGCVTAALYRRHRRKQLVGREIYVPLIYSARPPPRQPPAREEE